MRENASTHENSESAFDRLASGLGSLPEAVAASLSADDGAGGHGNSMGRRKFLLAAGAAGTAALAGCPSTVRRRFSAPPLVLPDAAQERHEYTESTVEAVTTERSGSKAGIDFEATIENHLAVYTPGRGDGGGPVPPVGSFASPNASVQGTPVNPLATDSLRAIVAGDAVPRVRDEVLTRLGRLAGSEIAWEQGPEEIDVRSALGKTGQELDTTGELLGEDVEVRTFGGIARGGEGSHAVLVVLARRVAEDVGIVASVLDKPLDDGGTDRPIVGLDGHFGPDHVRVGVETYLDLLGLFQVQGGGGTATPTPVPTSAPASKSSGSGPPFVIDDFEDGSLSEYTQSKYANASVVSSPTKRGSKSLRFTNMQGSHGITSTGGLAHYPHLGDRFRVWFRFEQAPKPDRGAFRLEFGRDANGNTHRIEARRPTRNRSQSPSDWQVVLPGASPVSVSLSKKTWYAFDVSWGPTDITVDVIDASGATLGSASMPSNGDNGTDHVAFEAYPDKIDFLWDYAHILGGARNTYPKIIDDFEDGNKDEYSDLGIVNTSFVSSPAKHGSRALEFTDQYWYGIRSPTFSTQSGPRLAHYPHQGDQFRVWFRFEKTPPAHSGGLGFGFGRDASGGSQTVSASKNQSGGWNVRLRGASPGNHRADSVTAALSPKTWYAFDVSWGPTDITVDVIDASGASLATATISANGDSGTDFVKFKSEVGPNNRFHWDYAHIHGHAR